MYTLNVLDRDLSTSSLPQVTDEGPFLYPTDPLTDPLNKVTESKTK